MGFGRSTPHEWALFNVESQDTRPMLEEALAIVPRMWTEDVFCYESAYVKVPPFTLVPRVLQDPHPPIWMAATSPDSFRLAGSLGVGVAGFTLSLPLAELEKRVRTYREALKDAQPVGRRINPRAAAFTYVYCAETEREAIYDGAPEAAAWYLSKVTDYYSQAPIKDGEGGTDFAFDPERRIQRLRERGDTPAMRLMIKIAQHEPVTPEEFYEAMKRENQCIIGTPDQVIRQMEEYAGIGLDQLMCLVQGGPSLPHAKIVKSLELMGEKVLPHFHGRN
jgi:alkanesulfonate monooxygenase SsuD/methylene tetrahydromethanopterin reductase-like flavin-dependent oxidoreductase (luciferase family)